VIVRVKLMGVLKDKTPAGGQLTLDDGATIAQALDALQIAADSVHVFTVDGALERNKQRILSEGAELTVLPPVGGG
jgi:sulfur carrier protein ThiS